jgi:hypothetical protein
VGKLFNKKINKVKQEVMGLAIYSHINKELFQIIDAKKVKTIYFAYEYEDWANGKSYPNENDVRLLNTFLGTHKHITMDIDESWMLPLLPEVEHFRFSKYDSEAIELLKSNTVRGLYFRHSADQKTDLTALLPFGDTLEYLFLDASQYKPYYNFEIMLNGMKKLKSLEVSSIKIDFSLVNENNVLENFYNFGSKTREWNDFIKFLRLKNLHFDNNTVLSDIDFLQNLTNLETAKFLYCSKIARFPDLSRLENLKEIYALECNRLEDIEELKKLKDVKIYVQGKMVPGKWYDNRNNLTFNM